MQLFLTAALLPIQDAVLITQQYSGIKRNMHTVTITCFL